MWNWLKTTIGGWISDFIQGFKDGFGIHSPSTVFADIGDYLIQGLWEGVKDKASWLKNKISGWVDDVIDGIKSFFGIHSPSTLMRDEIGENLVAGMVEGMSDTSALTKPLKNMWNGAKNWWNDKRSDLSYTPAIGSVYDKLKVRWDNAKTWWDKKKSGMKSYTPPIGSVYEKVSERWKNARDWWNKKKSALSTVNVKVGFLDSIKSGWNAAKKWWKNNVKLSIPSLGLKVSYNSVSFKSDPAKYAVVKALGMKGWPSLKFAADGGMFNAGSLIWAGERGPEVFANAGSGRTGVMNIQQMQEAVYEGVYAAVTAAMRNNVGGSQAVNVYLDGKLVTQSVEKRQHERGASIMGSEVYSY